MDADELVDIYNSHGKLVGSGTRFKAEDENLIILNAILFIFDPSGKVWLQQRADHKRHYPGLWDTTACGAIVHGEDPRLAAERELQEETSLVTPLTLVEKFLNSFPDEDKLLTRTRLSYLYIGRSDDTPKPNHEVKQFAKFSEAAILARVKSRPADFIPSMELELQKAFAGYKNIKP